MIFYQKIRCNIPPATTSSSDSQKANSSTNNSHTKETNTKKKKIKQNTKFQLFSYFYFVLKHNYI